MDCKNIYSAIGLLFGTFVLLAFSIALYELLLQIATYFNLFDTANSSTITSRQILGHIIFVIFTFVIGVIILSYFQPYGESKISGEMRVLRDTADISGVSIPGILSF